MTTTERTAIDEVLVGPLEELERTQPRVIAAGGRTIVLFVDQGQVHALDNRCPHMGGAFR